MKGFDYSTITEGKLYDVLRPLGKAVCRSRNDVHYVGLENIPKEGGFILASNHLQALDPVYLSIAIEGRQVHYMGKKELFAKPIVRHFLTKLNGFPVVRGGADSEALNYAVRLVNEGYIFGIFPEGTRSKDHKPGKAKSGIARIALASHADILPVSIYNSDDMKKHTKMTIRFGKLIPFEELKLNEDSGRTEIHAAADYIMSKINELWSEGHCE